MIMNMSFSILAEREAHLAVWRTAGYRSGAALCSACCILFGQDCDAL